MLLFLIFDIKLYLWIQKIKKFQININASYFNHKRTFL